MKAKRATCMLLAVLGAAAAILGGCSEPKTAIAQPSSEGELSAASDIPAPSGATILTVKGAISKSNSAKGIRLDMATLEQMPITKATVYEPFLKMKVSFSGVLMDDFVEVVGAKEASKIIMTALDDFQAEIPKAELESSSVLLATREEGKRMKIRAGGPIRIVFLHDEGLGSNTDAWIWSVVRMQVQA